MLLAWPLLFLSERSLWVPGSKRFGLGHAAVLGLGLGIAAWGTFGLWGGLVERLVR